MAAIVAVVVVAITTHNMAHSRKDRLDKSQEAMEVADLMTMVVDSRRALTMEQAVVVAADSVIENSKVVKDQEMDTHSPMDIRDSTKPSAAKPSRSTDDRWINTTLESFFKKKNKQTNKNI